MDQELAIREAESLLGILAVMSGPVMAVRRELIPDMDDSVGDDCLIPLEVVSKVFSSSLPRSCSV